MRTTFIAVVIASLFALTGCKYPDTVKTHPHVDEDFGGTVEWHPYVKKDYNDFQNWAMGKNCTAAQNTDPVEPGPALAGQNQ